LRAARGLTQEELAHRAELDVSFISRMERGLTQPSIGIFLRIASALETSPARLIGEIERAID
jgi:transcriptional regulator with XRE-family HTH domain